LSTKTVCGQPIENDGNWGQWTFFAKTYLSEKADILKKLNCKMKIEKFSLAS